MQPRQTPAKPKLDEYAIERRLEGTKTNTKKKHFLSRLRLRPGRPCSCGRQTLCRWSAASRAERTVIAWRKVAAVLPTMDRDGSSPRSIACNVCAPGCGVAPRIDSRPARRRGRLFHREVHGRSHGPPRRGET